MGRVAFPVAVAMVTTPVRWWLTARAIRNLHVGPDGTGARPNHSRGFTPVPCPGSTPLAKALSKEQVYVEGLVGMQDVIARARQLVPQGRGRENAVGPAILAIIEASDLRTGAHGQVFR